jgi:hypothetical protein
MRAWYPGWWRAAGHAKTHRFFEVAYVELNSLLPGGKVPGRGSGSWRWGRRSSWDSIRVASWDRPPRGTRRVCCPCFGATTIARELIMTVKQAFLDTRQLFPPRDMILGWDNHTEAKPFKSVEGLPLDDHDRDYVLWFLVGTSVDPPQVKFRCRGGVFEFDEKMAPFLRGHGTPFLVVVGVPIVVDLTSIPVRDVYMMALHPGVPNDSSLVFDALPGTYRTGYAASEHHAAISFRVNNTGTIDLDDDASRFVERVPSEGGTTRIVGAEVTVDASKLGADVTLLATTLPTARKVTARLLPDGWHHVQISGTKAKLRFRLTSQGAVQIDPSQAECVEQTGNCLVLTKYPG